MKTAKIKQFILTGIIVILIGFNSFAQNPNGDKRELHFNNNLKLNIFELMSSRPVLSVQYERLISPGISILCNVDLMYSASSDNWLKTHKGWGVQPAIRYYPAYGGVPRGFYIAGFASYFTQSFSVSSTNELYPGQTFRGELNNINSMGAGGLLGWKWIIRNAFTIDAGIGGGYLTVSSPSRDLIVYNNVGQNIYQESSPEQTRTELSPNAELSLGFIF